MHSGGQSISIIHYIAKALFCMETSVQQNVYKYRYRYVYNNNNIHSMLHNTLAIHTVHMHVTTLSSIWDLGLFSTARGKTVPRWTEEVQPTHD